MKLATALIATGLLVSVIVGLSYGRGEYQYPPAQTQPQTQPADVKTQLKTAVTHAGFAAGGDSMSYVTQHLGHVLNCIAGARGKNFNQSWGHVCQGQGNGILADLKTASGGADFILVADAADSLAVAGVKSKNLGEIKMAAKGVAVLLSVIADNLK